MSYHQTSASLRIDQRREDSAHFHHDGVSVHDQWRRERLRPSHCFDVRLYAAGIHPPAISDRRAVCDQYASDGLSCLQIPEHQDSSTCCMLYPGHRWMRNDLAIHMEPSTGNTSRWVQHYRDIRRSCGVDNQPRHVECGRCDEEVVHGGSAVRGILRG